MVLNASLYWEQLKAMYKKDWLVRKRHWIVTIFELFMPILLVGIHLYSLPNKSTNNSILTRQSMVQAGSSPRLISERKSYSSGYSDDYNYNSDTFHCYYYRSTIYYTTPIGNASDFLIPSIPQCYATTVYLPNYYELLKAWGDSLSYYAFTYNDGFTFHNLELDKGVVNYTIGAKSLWYQGPWGDGDDFGAFKEFLLTQSIVNILLAWHPNEQNITRNDFEYHYTNKLFQEGNPNVLQNLAQSNDTWTVGTLRTSPVQTIDFYQCYTFLEVGFLYLSTIITRRVVQEKVTNSKELLRIMGLTDLIYWFSHFINYLSLSIFHGTAITILYSSFPHKNPYNGWNGSVFWFNYVMNSVTNILFTFAFSTILTRPIIGVLIVMVGRAGLAYIPFAAQTSNYNLLWISPKAWSCLLPSGQIHYSIYDLLYFGLTKTKVTWSNLFDSIGIEDTISLKAIYFVTIISWFLYFVLIWYLDAVWPWQPGTPKPWHFPVSDLFNKPVKNIEIEYEANDTDNISFNLSDINSENNNRPDNNHELEPNSLKPSIQCINLYKSFGSMGAKKFAVNGLNLNILKGQITALLGHNGAGKTTTMSMITGILKPTSGNILIDGIDVHRNVVAARRLLALCPQTDLLFEELTVTENLNLCAGLRGLSAKVKKDLIPLNIKRVNLTDKVNTLASNLSGGMRRRLQLALALSTASEILILDEPTSGLDPESRRQLWDLLLELRKDLTILLTTHFMEEADALGDRIIIMDSGKVKCSGSSMFLKRRYGAGNSIRLAKDPWTFEPNRLSHQIRFHYPNAVVTNETNEEIIYQLSEDSKKSNDGVLVDLCDALDSNLTTIGITSYGIAVTTLEDVFLKVAEDDGATETALTSIQMEDKLFELNRILDYVKLNGLSLTLQRIKGLVMKRFHFTRRHYKTIGFTIILPALVILFTFYASRNAISLISSSGRDYTHPIELNVKSNYGENAKAVIRASFTGSQPFIEAYRAIMQESGIDVIEIPLSLSMTDYMNTSAQSADQFMQENIFGIIEDSGQLEGFSIWYNPLAALALPLGVDAWTNALIRVRNAEWSSSRVTTTYALMPNHATDEPYYESIAALIISALFGPIAFSLIACSYFLFPSAEANSKANLIQKMSGIKAPIFWFSHFIFDFFYHIIVSIVVIISINILDRFPFTSFRIFTAVVLLLVLYGTASIPLFYLLSFLPIKPDRGFSLLTTFSLVGSLIGSALAASLLAFDKIKSIHVFFGDLFPPFAMSFGLAKIYGLATLQKECDKLDACNPGNALIREHCCVQNTTLVSSDPFEWEKGINSEIVMLLADTVLYITLLIVFDLNLHRLGYWYDTIRKRLSASPQSQGGVEDDDVTAEKARVKQLLASGISNSAEALVVHELNKDFGSFRAVDQISFGVHKAECFGLLGVNGAGKTTTFRMLTGDLMVTHGDAFVGPYSLKKDLLNFQQSISYCPQFDALIENLTPQETLTLFARIRGMPEDKVKANVEYIISSTDLTRFAKTCNQNLSGGNKRKLSLAIAAIAKPQVIFLDEPTTGVDPASRRKIWSTLIYLRETSGSSIVLTSHSMDECEALCSRIGIMSRGDFKCLGSTQHLKQKFGQGFTLVIKINQEALKKDGEVQRIKKFIQEKFPSSILRDFHQTLLHYHITDTSSRWGDMLRSLNQGKASLLIEDYTLSGTSLEQIFLSFAKES